MPTLLVAAPAPFSGKTTVAVALARNLSRSGGLASLARTGDDANAQGDRATLGVLSGSSETTIVELPSGAVSDDSYAGARVLVVATPDTANDAAALAKTAGDSLAGVVLNRVPVKGERAPYQGLAPVAVIAEDRVLGAPDLASAAASLGAQVENLEGRGNMTLDALLIASIAADPGQAYFDRTRASVVIVRSDKPDLQLAALNSGAEAFIITGGLSLLSYVRDRVAEDEVPVLHTALDTKDAVSAIEKLFGKTPFLADDAKLARLDALFAALDVNRLLG